jgi:hypothetical protein
MGIYHTMLKSKLCDLFFFVLQFFYKGNYYYIMRIKIDIIFASRVFIENNNVFRRKVFR